MQYLNTELMDAISSDRFRATRPYPWLNPEGMIVPAMLPQLLADLPGLDQFTPSFGYERKYGQAAHDRYMLEYTESLEVAPSWRQFIDELCSATYREFVCRLFDINRVNLSFQWHCTPRGASVSPHVDSRRKIGSQIFYLNTQDEWNSDWGGQTLILDDRGEFSRESSPDLDSFYSCEAATIGENRSLIFEQGEKSWHAVKALECPEGAFRKVFIVRYEKVRPVAQIRKRLVRAVKGETPQERTVF